MDLLFQYIETVPASEFYPYIEEANEAMLPATPLVKCHVCGMVGLPERIEVHGVSV